LLRIFNFKLFPTSRTTFVLLASIIGHKHTQSKQTHILRTKHQSKENFKGTHYRIGLIRWITKAHKTMLGRKKGLVSFKEMVVED
jgi:hypothetical protein